MLQQFPFCFLGVARPRASLPSGGGLHEHKTELLGEHDAVPCCVTAACCWRVLSRRHGRFNPKQLETDGSLALEGDYQRPLRTATPLLQLNTCLRNNQAQ